MGKSVIATRLPAGRQLVMLAVAGLLGLALSAPVSAGQKQASQDIVDTAVAAGSFDTLVAALQAAELVDALRADGPYTVFAPTDEAFAKLPAGTLEGLLKPENQGQLQAILLYHVVPGKIMAADIGSSARPETLQGAAIDVTASSEGVKVNSANVVAADVVASNGVIHVIDTVILPPAAVATR